MSRPEETIGAACPEGGQFYVCESGFVGCCREDACKTSTGHCRTSFLEPMSFDADKYADIPPQDCFDTDSGVEWWACTGTRNFPFMGCCVINPCTEGSCPPDQLRRSKVSNNPADAQIFLGDDSTTTTDAMTTSSTTSASTTTSISTATSITEASSETTAEAGTPGQSNEDDGVLSQGAIIGIAVGATAAGILAICLFIFWCWRRVKRSREHADASNGPVMRYGGNHEHESSRIQHMKQHQSQYSPNTASFQGGYTPQSASFTHPHSPHSFHDRTSYHPSVSSSTGLQAPTADHQWAASTHADPQSVYAAGSGGWYNRSPPAHITHFNIGGGDEPPSELSANTTQRRSELSTLSEMPVGLPDQYPREALGSPQSSLRVDRG